MNLRELGYKIDVDKTLVKPFEERVLASGMCDFALDMCFSNYRGVKRIRYDCSGYVCITDLDLNQDKLLLEVLEKTLLTFAKSEEFFIDMERITLNVDTVFYNRKYKDVKIAYVPLKRDVELNEKIIQFIHGLKEKGEGKGIEYLEKIENIFVRNNCSLKEMIRVVGEVRRALFRRENPRMVHDKTA